VSRNSAGNLVPGISRPESHAVRAATLALLPKHKSDALMVFASEMCTWQHACLHEPTFEREILAFWGIPDTERLTKVDHAWLALFFTVQCIALNQMNPKDAALCGLGEGCFFHLCDCLLLLLSFCVENRRMQNYSVV
jgi:hypothetical protein